MKFITCMYNYILLHTHSLLPPAGEDYEQFSVDLSFDADTNRACFTVTVTNDTRYELPESFDLVLTSSDDSVIIDEPTSVFNINDDDGKCM